MAVGGGGGGGKLSGSEKWHLITLLGTQSRSRLRLQQGYY